MSTNNRIRVMIGLTVVGSMGWAAARDDGDATPNSDTPAAVSTTADERYLLLTNGQVIKGVITKEGNEYVVRQRVGVMRFVAGRAEGAFDSLRAAYQHRVEQLPERDSDERIKLAHWCLNQKLKNEAREQLLKVLDLDPNHPQAKAMLFSMAQATAIASQRQRDPEVRQTGADTMKQSRPAALDSAVIQGAQRGLGISGAPVIFDLPKPLAIKRANEFAQYVHPVLQAYCARCHDGNYNGEFQLVPIRSRADRTPDAFRANLDATLRLVDAENPAKSELLSSTLRPHGDGPRLRPIFPGSNDKTYQILSTWVQSLRHPRNAAVATHADPGRTNLERDEAFAAERPRDFSEGRAAGMPLIAGGAERPPLSAGLPTEHDLSSASRVVPGRDPNVRGGKPAAPDEFPLPFAITGKKPNMPTAQNPANPATSRAPSSTTVPRPSSGTTGSGTAKPGTSADARDPSQQAKPPADPGAAKKKKTPVTIDPKLLENLLNRNGGR